MHPHHSFDAAYVQRLKEGDPATETHFCHYFGDLARIKATSRLRSAEPADDIRQETLLRVLRIIRQGGIEHPERLGAFVNAVCGNVILEYLRRNKRLSQFPEEQTDVPSEEASAEVGLLKEERTTLVKRALDDLSPKDRELLRRIFLEEHDKDVVCQELKVSREYLRVLLHRARVRLRSALNKGRRSARAD